ncbi:protein tyrosine phosphatase [Rhizobiaceae bacterium BDR2-2]|uniref:Protein tyrosine phosphatase n=1 Tax=Ectorhizobium quercum TaxID=2965071 RepID=A0AAE3N1J4_9HYPH|nr:protein tyrosine phosphatase [Ectorhizobium quercum]MCX8999073.1 protein tyrosine phosphatase [Ectorhizobium quercum]
MSLIVVSPLGRIAEMAVRHRVRDMVSLLSDGHDFHRPGLIAPERHLVLRMHDIGCASAGRMTGPQDAQVAQLIAFARAWDRAAPLLIHCWMGISRSPAAALVAALAVMPETDERDLALRLRKASPFATPNARLVALGDALLGREERLTAAVKHIGRGADADGNAPFVLPLDAGEAADG